MTPRPPASTFLRAIAGLVAAAAAAACAGTETGALAPYRVQGNGIREALLGLVGDAARGREVVTGRTGNCLLCHAVPETGERLMGNLAPPLSGVAGRLTAGELRLRIVDSRRINADTIMPPYYATEGLARVAAAYRGEPVLTAQEVEDLVAYLLTLR